MNSIGIIDSVRNPFATKSWIAQGYRFTKHRRTQVANVLFKSVDEISELPRNDGRYVAFVAIRWGFAEINDGKLLPTQKLGDHQNIEYKKRYKH